MYPRIALSHQGLRSRCVSSCNGNDRCKILHLAVLSGSGILCFTQLLPRIDSLQGAYSMLHHGVRLLRLAIYLILLLIAVSSATFAQTEQVLHGFQAPGDGVVPLAGLVQDSAGNFYGTTSSGGANGHGTIFKLDLAGNETLLHSFNGTDGANPRSTLIRDTAGNFFGTTYVGGTFNSGTVFKLDSMGTLTVLYSFTGGADGRGPIAGLLLDTASNLYGTTYYGGDLSCPSISNPSGCGVVFKVNTAGKETVLHAFTGGNDGAFPLGGLVAGGGSLYGTTVGGGTQGFGTVYRVHRRGSEKVLHSFIASSTSDAGLGPLGRLLRDNAGNL